ncbi:hypothetical protein CCH79_00012416 [Gambusia affinis]|uniref:Uncharacterized protein n=1 Tax=Gambusia affinis TaxID=33528 RepID=A0A315WA94_GAMAF|nr:hypothetical protein CCH79_00012416 [Gambusia affinis]
MERMAGGGRVRTVEGQAGHRGHRDEMNTEVDEVATNCTQVSERKSALGPDRLHTGHIQISRCPAEQIKQDTRVGVEH